MVAWRSGHSESRRALCGQQKMPRSPTTYSFLIEACRENLKWSHGGVVTHRSAKPSTLVQFQLRPQFPISCRGDEMVYIGDLKSPGRKSLRVRVSPAVQIFLF